MVNTKATKKGDIFSESSHYTLIGAGAGDNLRYLHLETGTEVTIGNSYAGGIFKSADQFTKIVKVGKEDKSWTQKQIEALKGITDPEWAKANGLTTELPNVGDLRVKGIRSIWEDIHSQHVFTVCYKKADVPLSAKKLKELQDAQVEMAWAAIEATQKSKKGVAEKAKKTLAYIQQNPIFPFVEGEERVLRGFKVQFTSRDGRYDCIDMDIDTQGGKVSALRPVNINTISYLIFDGVKYEVE